MSIRVYNRYLDLLFEIDRYQSLQFKRNYHGIGDFELHVNRYINGADTLEKGHLIALNKQSNKVGIILTKEIALDEGGKETENFKLTGYTLDGLMQRRITVPPSHTSHDRISGSAETVMKHYVYKNFVDTTKERQMPFLEIADSLGRGSHVKYESRYKTVSDELEKISINTGLGWGVFANFSTKKLIFDVIERKDLTQDNAQGNNPVFFSPEFETIKSQEFIDSDNDLRNVGFVGGQGEGVDRKIVKIGDVSGWDRIETFVDARDISDEDEETEEELTDEEVEELLIERGQKKMSDMETIFTLEAEIQSPNIDSPFIYERDYDLGDYVDVVNKSWNLTMTAPITEITEIYESDGFKLDAVFGRNRPTLISKLNDKFNELEGIEKQEAPEKVSVSYSKENKKYTEQKSQEDREYTDKQDEVYDEKAKKFTKEKANEALNDAIAEAVRQDELVRKDAQGYANKAEENAKSASVAREEYNERVEEIRQDISEQEKIVGELKGDVSEAVESIGDKVDAEYVDGQLQSKADKDGVYSKEETDGMFDNVVSVTEYETDQDGIIKDLKDQSSRITQTEKDISSKVDSSTYKQDKDSLETEIGNNKSSIEQNAKEIASKVSDSQYNTDKEGILKDISDNKSQITQTAEKVESKVDVSYVEGELGKIEVGGRNLASKSSNMNPYRSAEWDGYKLLIDSGEDDRQDGLEIEDDSFVKNENYVLSFKIKKTSGTIRNLAGHSTGYEVTKGVFIDGEKTGNSWSSGGSNSYPDDGEEHKVVVYLKYTKDTEKDSNTKLYIQPNRSSYDYEYTAEIWDIQLEKGNKATDWTPAPEDVQEEITSVRDYASDIEQTAKGIRTDVTAMGKDVKDNMEEVKKAHSSIDQNASAIEQRVKTTDFDEANERITDAEGELKTLAGEVSAKVSQKDFDNVEGRVEEAESELKLLPGEIDAKVEKDGVVGAINATPEELLIDFGRVKMEGALEARHIKSLNGLNVGDQFIVDSDGNVTFAGRMQALEGYFGDNLRLVDGKLEIVRPDGAVSTTDGMVKASQAIQGFDPMFMTMSLEDSGFRNTSFYNSNGYYFSGVAPLDGRESGFRDVRDSDYRSSIRIQRYQFLHSARYLVFTYRTREGTGSGFRGNMHEHLALIYDDKGEKLVDHTVKTNTAETVDLVVDLGTPDFTSRWFDFRIGWAKSWGTKDDYIYFRINNVLLTDFI